MDRVKYAGRACGGGRAAFRGGGAGERGQGVAVMVGPSFSDGAALPVRLELFKFKAAIPDAPPFRQGSGRPAPRERAALPFPIVAVRSLTAAHAGAPAAATQSRLARAAPGGAPMNGEYPAQDRRHCRRRRQGPTGSLRGRHGKTRHGRPS